MSRGSGNEYSELVAEIMRTNPFQKKKLLRFLESRDEYFYLDANQKIEKLFATIKNDDPIRRVSEYFSKMSLDFLRAQIKFKETNKYPVSDHVVTKEAIYENKEIMTYYMYGLFASYFLWPNHHQIYKYFKEVVRKVGPVRQHLEIAPGHGLFTLSTKSEHACASTLIDISETSLDITRAVLEEFRVNTNITYINTDFFKSNVGQKFDFIVMGEVLEHVNNPTDFLSKAKELLNDSGTVFITTCTDAPAIDHVFHFRDLNEIRKLCTDSGLSILEELAIPADYDCLEAAKNNRSTINYCALLSRQEYPQHL